MHSLIDLELKRNNIKIFIRASVIITAIMMGFLYLFAFMPVFASLEGDADLAIFSNYNSIISLTSVLNMACFSVLSAVMYSKFVIEEYKGKRAILLFSYPVSRMKIFYSKIILVLLFTIAVTLVSNLAIFTVFGLSEMIYSVVNDTISIATVIKVIRVSFIMACLAGGFGTISMFAGFIKKSVPTTIVTSVILCSLISNIAVSNPDSDKLIMFVTLVILLVSFVLSNMVAGWVNKIEV